MTGLLPPQLETFVVQMPKIELHVHLEGTIRPATLLEIAQRNRVELPARDVAGVAQLFKYRSFKEFLTVFMSLARALQTGEDFAQIAYEYGHDLADQHVWYAEVMISPSQYYNRGLDLHEIVQGILAGFAQVQQERGIRLQLIFDYGRQFGPEAAWQVLEIAGRYPSGLVGWSIGGDELNYPPEIYQEVFASARQRGLRLMAHAGEVVGPPSVWGAIDTLGCERIGHGFRSIDDPRLVQQLIQRQITLDISLSSNFRTGACLKPYTHPIRRLFDAGVPITINSDDPTFFETTLTNELHLAAGLYAFDARELSQTMVTAAQAAFLPPTERAALAATINQSLTQLRRALALD